MFVLVLAALLLQLCAIVDPSEARTSAELRVRLSDGSPIVGRYLRSHDGHGIRAFMGIPYAEPPLGELRFRVSGGEIGVIFKMCPEHIIYVAYLSN